MSRKGLDQQENSKSIQQQELELIERIKGGDYNAFGILVTRYQTRLMQFIYRKYGNNGLVEDVVQNVFVLAFRKLDSFQGKSMFYTWLCTIAIRQMINAIHAQARRPALKLEAEMSQDESIVNIVEMSENQSFSVEDLVLDDERREELDRIVEQIPSKLLTPLILTTENGMSYQEVADHLGISLDSVRSRINRARNEFKRLLKESQIEL